MYCLLAHAHAILTRLFFCLSLPNFESLRMRLHCKAMNQVLVTVLTCEKA